MGFHYQDLNDPALADEARTAAKFIKDAHRDVERLPYEIGKRLIEMNQKLRHGHWGKWLKLECQMSRSQANRYIHIATNLANVPSLGNLPPSTQMLLAESSTPDTVRKEIMADVEAGVVPTGNQVKARIAAAKAPSVMAQPRLETQDNIVSAPILRDFAVMRAAFFFIRL